MEIFLTAFGLVAIGLTLLFGGAGLLGEYRKFFWRIPRLAMSTEVFAYLSELGGPGYLAALLIFAGAWISLIGCLILAFGAVAISSMAITGR